MEFTGQVEERMIDALRKANTISLDIDSGDKEFKLNASFDEMLEIGAGIVSYLKPSVVVITAYDSENNERVISYHPSCGNWEYEEDQWITIDETPSTIILSIAEPTDKTLWDIIRRLNLTATFNACSNADDVEFSGTRDSLERFVKITHTPLLADDVIQTIKAI
jgi:hypothetical protein